MEESLNQWQDSPGVTKKTRSYVISDSDEDSENTEKEQIFVIESSEASVNSLAEEDSSSEELSSTEEGIRRRIKKHIPQYSDSEDISDHNENDSVSISSSEEHNTDDSTSNDEIEKMMKSNDKILMEEGLKDVPRKIQDNLETNASNISKNISSNNNLMKEHVSKKREKCEESYFSSDSESHTDEESSSQLGTAISLAKQEIGVNNIDPVIAQKRALLVCKMEQLQNELSKTKLLLTAGNIDLLPDKGKRLHESIVMQEREIETIAAALERTPLTQIIKSESHSVKQEMSFVEEEKKEKEPYSEKFNSYYDSCSIRSKLKSSAESGELGKQAQATLDRERSLTVDRLQDLHGSLVARPTEEDKAEDPQGLKVKLMPHQQHALAWLMWREQQRPPGGVLADDMGLGKTLTMISLIIASIAKGKSEESNSEEWVHCDPSMVQRCKGGTLVVCPASLLSQWENEIDRRCKRGMLSVKVYHGTNRENVPKRLAKNDVVITTYNILLREFKSNSMAYKIHWERIILDEAHVIRNHKSQASQSVCGLVANKRWALTGTPIQNKEMDLYPILKFLKCTPFDDLRVWKRWVDNKSTAGRQRLATVMKTLMLRRTKQELQANGMLESLPEKFVEEILIKLDPEEQLVYEKVLIYSRTLFAQFLAQRADKDHMVDLAAGKYDKPTFLSNPNKNTQFTKAQNKLLSLHADVKTHEILVLLLRLRQICVHPSLIHSMLDEEDIEDSDIREKEDVNSDLLSQMNNITLEESENNEEETNEKEIGIDRRVASNLLTSKNPVFKCDRVSSKIRKVLDTVTDILQKNDKIIIVSQWTSTLNIIASCLSSIKGASFNMFTGNVPIKERQGIMDSFNAPNDDPKILLLSLTAGGVGLNLVGGNHLLLIDIHWNPQLEVQAQDRIYRFGQKKDVFIYKFICRDTIEERIKNLQERKIEIAQNVLSGDKNSAVSKLTLNDLKSLFGL
ncbi:transcription termination factor 2 isoform X1 [Bombus huntii]|uniref:transcription termination factor 2 isoform X1 n=1 Tax=Bombus huntii TaxID=85661 RepID=UPI0021AA4F97|nr:transcription termination factor 2 isoform X1 [Bombus huntii]XP_050470438.1 transcription termination factor 2 isoform X1 [Bombus huntii]XP_050470439.1 transcription termination factor 2 isoform X1 [Bombus huntii]XP_050470440.1 transcription termination factor 2 isoform X1 [Bombus huntii]